MCDNPVPAPDFLGCLKILRTSKSLSSALPFVFSLSFPAPHTLYSLKRTVCSMVTLLSTSGWEETTQLWRSEVGNETLKSYLRYSLLNNLKLSPAMPSLVLIHACSLNLPEVLVHLVSSNFLKMCWNRMKKLQMCSRDSILIILISPRNLLS